MIDGAHYVTPSSNLRHREILGRLHLLIGVWLASHERAREIMTGNWMRGAPPELVVEIGGELRSELFPGLELPLARVFESSAAT